MRDAANAIGPAVVRIDSDSASAAASDVGEWIGRRGVVAHLGGTGARPRSAGRVADW